MIDEIIQGLSTKGWIQVEGVIAPNSLCLINRFFDQNKADFFPARVGRGETKKFLPEVRGDHTYWLDPLGQNEDFKTILNFLGDLKTGLNRSLYLGAKEFECHLAYYAPGTFYQKHTDRFDKDSSRVISFIFYLHEAWEQGDGGELVLYDQNENYLQELRPLPGSLVCFLSGDFPHEVKTCNKERRTLTGWMHTKVVN